MSIKSMFRYFIFLVIGMSFIVYGIMEIVTTKNVKPELTDEQIIQRAKELGMIEVKEAWILEMTNQQ